MVAMVSVLCTVVSFSANENAQWDSFAELLRSGTGATTTTSVGNEQQHLSAFFLFFHQLE